MIELAQWLVGGAIGVGSVVAGAWAGWRFRGTRRPALICTCGHGSGTHDPIEGSCGDKVRRISSGADVWEPCPCRHYDGPDPLLLR